MSPVVFTQKAVVKCAIFFIAKNLLRLISLPMDLHHGGNATRVVGDPYEKKTVYITKCIDRESFK